MTFKEFYLKLEEIYLDDIDNIFDSIEVLSYSNIEGMYYEIEDINVVEFEGKNILEITTQ